MTPLQFVKLYGMTAALLFAIDLVWIGVVAAPFYRSRLGALMAPEVRWGAALLFYLIFVAGLLVFATLPALAAGSALRAALLGGFLGLVAYATFDLTSFALFRDFPLSVVVVDMAWGTALSAGVATAAWAMGRYLL